MTNPNNDTCELNLNELDAVTGGATNMETPPFFAFYSALYDNAGPLGQKMLNDSFDKVRGHA
jgi:hypothetical protein